MQKRRFMNMGRRPGLSNVLGCVIGLCHWAVSLGCVDGTQMHIQGPTRNEHEYVNRRGKHSINVQIVCDADLTVINCVVKNPGSVHDARMLRESALWRMFENQSPKIGSNKCRSGISSSWPDPVGGYFRISSTKLNSGL